MTNHINFCLKILVTVITELMFFKLVKIIELYTLGFNINILLLICGGVLLSLLVYELYDILFVHLVEKGFYYKITSFFKG